MLDKIIECKEFFAIAISFLAVIVPLYQYLNAKKKEQEWLNFENFHEKIIRKISNREGITGLDEQVAVIFDLRRFPEYFSVLQRILMDLKKWWSPQLTEKPHFSRLINEANETIEYIKVNKNLFKRTWLKIKDSYL